MTLSHFFDNRKQPLATFKAYLPTGAALLELTGDDAHNLIILIDGKPHSMTAFGVQRLIQIGLDIAEVTAPIAGLPGRFALLTAVELERME